MCLQVFVENRIFKTYQRFCFLCFFLVDAFSGSIKTEKSQKIILFTLAESNFGEKKTFEHSLELWRNFICGNETGSPGLTCDQAFFLGGERKREKGEGKKNTPDTFI